MTKLLRIPEAAELLGIPEATLRHWRATNKPGVPHGANLGGRRVVYRESEILAWIDAQFEAADGEVSA